MIVGNLIRLSLPFSFIPSISVHASNHVEDIRGAASSGRNREGLVSSEWVLVVGVVPKIRFERLLENLCLTMSFTIGDKFTITLNVD